MAATRTAENLWRRWTALAESNPGCEAIVHYQAGVATRRWTREELLSRALGHASALSDLGVKPRDVCGIILKHDPEFYPLYQGIVALGAIPAVLAYPNPRLHPAKFRDGLRGMSRTSGLDWILTDGQLHPMVEPLTRGSGSTVRGVIHPLESGVPAERSNGVVADPAADEPCLLQHSSGTTGLQKGVMLSHKSVLEHVRRYGAAIGLSAADRVVSWLPLYHDMGLIAAFQLPLAAGVAAVMLDPIEWVTAPVLFLQACSAERGTVAWLPNFAYNLMASRVNEEDMADVRLDSVRLLVNCSEPVRSDSHDRFAERFADHGFRREALGACYAMAEATFSVTQTRPGAEARRLWVFRDALREGRAETSLGVNASRAVVSSGAPIEGCAIRVVGGEAGVQLPDRMVGELHIRSVSLFDGYRNNPDATRPVLRDGWYNTGDLGFRENGEYFVIGRRKDLIIVAGKNIYPEDIEDAVNEVKGVYPGRVVAFGLEDQASGTERVCIIAEITEQDPSALPELKAAVIAAGMGIDVTISEVYLVEPRWLIKSSAGKPSRAANKARIVARSVPSGVAV